MGPCHAPVTGCLRALNGLDVFDGLRDAVEVLVSIWLALGCAAEVFSAVASVLAIEGCWIEAGGYRAKKRSNLGGRDCASLI